MPTYSYRCTECSTAFDIQQAFTDDSLTECPTCQGRLRKVFSSIGVTFNGSGFYRNDSRAGERTSGSGSKDSGSKDSGSTDSGSKDSGSKDSGTGGSGSGSTGSGTSGSTPAKKETSSAGAGSSTAAAAS